MKADDDHLYLMMGLEETFTYGSTVREDGGGGLGWFSLSSRSQSSVSVDGSDRTILGCEFFSFLLSLTNEQFNAVLDGRDRSALASL